MKRGREYPQSSTLLQHHDDGDDKTTIERKMDTHLDPKKEVRPMNVISFTRMIFVLVSLLLIIHKVALCLEILNFTSTNSQVLSTVFWLPSLFLEDFIFLSLFYLGSRKLSFCCFLTIALYISTIAMVNMAWLLVNHEVFPWHMATWAWNEREIFSKMFVALTKDLPFVYLFLSVAAWACCLLLWILWETRDKNRVVGIQKRQSSRNLLPFLSLQKTQLSSFGSRVDRNKHLMYGFWLLVAFYVALAQTIRPHEPYKSISATPFISVPLEIRQGFRDHYYERLSTIPMRESTATSSRTSDAVLWDDVIQKLKDGDHSTTNDKPMNVVLVFLESVRSDMMPFNKSTAWAKRFLENSGLERDHVTPFYENWIMHPWTVHVPKIKSASGFTAKSLFSTLCSSYALPLYHTREHTSKLYRQCLPRILQRLGYSTRFFQSPIESFDHQREMMQNIGFPNIFGKESFDRQYNTTQEFEDLHRTNYFGYDDDVMLKPMMDWVDNEMNNNNPFFLSYLSGVTHDPYNVPPAEAWDPKYFSHDTTANGYLNGLAYTDDFLRKMVAEFERRHLMKSTLFVFVGDHGGDFADRGAMFKTWSVPFEEAFDVSVSFHTRNSNRSRQLAALDQNADGIWTSLDILPTIVEIALHGVPTAFLDGRRNSSLVDGRSMLHSPGRRLTFSIPNPGCGMVLRDWPYSIIVNCDESRTTTRVYDLNADPEQKTKLFLVNDALGADPATKKLLDWGETAFLFLERLKADLVEAHGTGVSCLNCALSSLQHLETLKNPD